MTSLDEFAATPDCPVCALPDKVLREVNGGRHHPTATLQRWLERVHGVPLTWRQVRNHQKATDGGKHDLAT